MNRHWRRQNRQGVIAVALALVLAVGMWGGLAVAPERVAAAGMSPAPGGGCSTASFMEVAGSPFGAGNTPVFVAVGDFNRDGKPDLAVANFGDNTVTIRLGDGTGAFPTSSTVGAGTSIASVAVGDFNGDGKPDLAVANFNSNNVTIRLGDGAGAFATSATVGAGTFPQSVAVGDFNRDGKPDLAVANFGSNNVTVQLNTCTANHAPVANAGPDQTVECAGATTPVTLDGSASSDPDGDTLTYSWSEAGAEIATGVSPMVNLAFGVHTITLTAKDPSNASATDSLTVKVVDTTPPTITLNGANPMTVECHTSFTDPFATATDGCAGLLP